MTAPNTPHPDADSPAARTTGPGRRVSLMALIGTAAAALLFGLLLGGGAGLAGGRLALGGADVSSGDAQAMATSACESIERLEPEMPEGGDFGDYENDPRSDELLAATYLMMAAAKADPELAHLRDIGQDLHTLVIRPNTEVDFSPALSACEDI